MATSSYVKRKLVCYVTIGDNSGTPYDVVQVTTEFALNAIPTATITLALGMNTKTNEAAKAAEILDNLFTFRKSIRIWAENPTEDESVSLAGGLKASEAVKLQIIFEGYIAGVGYQRNASGSVLSVSVEHWLSDLAASSMMGASTHSMTPGDLQRSALLVNARAGDGVVQTRNAGLMGATWTSKVIGGAIGLVSNLWEGGIKKIAEAGAKAAGLIDVNRSADPTCANPSTKNPNNKAALDALAKMKGVLPLEGSTAENVKSAIYKDLTSIFLENFAGQTIWDVIVSASANYMFAVAPGINEANVIPFLPCLSIQPEPFYTLDAEQIFSVSLSGDMPRTIRGVALLFSTETGVMGGAPNETSLPRLRVGGAYIGTADCKGTVLYKQPPSWLSTASATYYALGADKKTNAPIKTGVSPTGGTPSGLESKTGTIKNTMELRDNYAKSLYGFEILKGRQGTISGPFRTDIGIGSYIEFEIPKDLHDPQSSNKYFRGMVLRVTTSLDAQSSQAMTTFTVGYVRTQVEDGEGILTMTKHPIYTTTYLGGRLDNK
jgi:hypothetical protein